MKTKRARIIKRTAETTRRCNDEIYVFITIAINSSKAVTPLGRHPYLTLQKKVVKEKTQPIKDISTVSYVQYKCRFFYKHLSEIIFFRDLY